MEWAKDSSPLDDLEPEAAGEGEPEVQGQRLPRSSRKRIYGVLCLAASASGRRTPGRLRVLATYRARLGITPQDAEVAETLAGHLKGVRIGKRQPEQDAVMLALVELLTADEREPTARERQLLERIGARGGWSPQRIEAAVQARLGVQEDPEQEDFELLDEDSGTGELLPAPAPRARAPERRAAEDPFGASLSPPALREEEDPFGASISPPALREEQDPFGASLFGASLAPPPASRRPARQDSLDPDADDPFDAAALGRALSADLDSGRASAAADPFAAAADPFADDPFAAAADPFADDDSDTGAVQEPAGLISGSGDLDGLRLLPEDELPSR